MRAQLRSLGSRTHAPRLLPLQRLAVLPARRGLRLPRLRAAAAADDGQPGQSASRSVEQALDELDLNQLQTALNTAIAAENYSLAGKIRDVLALVVGKEGQPGGDWRRLGILDWLADRAEDLGYRLPTEVQRRAAPVITDGDDCIIESETGSGKTLAFLLPALSLLSYPPDLYPDDLQGPQALIIVPTRELGVQAVMMAYKLLGGSVNPGVPGERGNMFRYTGPRGVKVKGLVMPEEVDMAVEGRYLGGAHVVVGTPYLIHQALERGVELTQHCRVIAVDEVDACFAEHPQAMAAIMQAAAFGFTISSPSGGPSRDDAAAMAAASSSSPRPPGSTSTSSSEVASEAAEGGSAATPAAGGRPSVVLVGATMDDALVERSVQQGWLQDPVRVTVGTRMRVPRGLRHRYIVTEAAGRVGAMCRQLRADLRAQSPDAAPARVMVFAPSDAQARAMADPIRTILWGDHKISVLLPDGVEPISALHSFRDNKTTLLLATPAAARGLDLPAVSHVYNVSLPADAPEYLHRAGRAGRIGSPVRGTVTTMVIPDEVPALMAIAETLGLQLDQAEAPAPVALGDAEGEVDMDAARRVLEDILALTPGASAQVVESSQEESSQEEEEE